MGCSKRLATEKDKEIPMEMICQPLQQHGAPQKQMDLFSGNPIHYQYFQVMAWETGKKRIKDPVGRLRKLINLKDGVVKIG